MRARKSVSMRITGIFVIIVILACNVFAANKEIIIFEPDATVERWNPSSADYLVLYSPASDKRCIRGNIEQCRMRREDALRYRNVPFVGAGKIINGQLWTLEGTELEIAGVKMTSQAPIPIHFSTHIRNGITIGEILTIKNIQQTGISFHPATKFLKVKPNQNIHLTIKSEMTELSISKSKIVLNDLAQIDAKIGPYVFRIDNTGFTLIKNTNDAASTTPLTIELKRKNRASMYLNIDDKNNFVIAQKAIHYNEIEKINRDEIKKKIPYLKDTGKSLSRIDYYLQNAPSILNIDHLEIVDPKAIEKRCGDNSGACVIGTTVIVPENVDEQSFRHEITHAHVFSLETLSKKSITGFIVRENLSFKDKWQKIAGNQYGYGLGAKVIDKTKAQRWADGTSIPKYGCVNAYGCNNLDEDIATFVEKISEKDPLFFSQLLDQDSAQYEPKYIQKIELLREYKLITPKEYEIAIKTFLK